MGANAVFGFTSMGNVALASCIPGVLAFVFGKMSISVDSSPFWGTTDWVQSMAFGRIRAKSNV